MQAYKQQIRELERYTRFVIHPAKRNALLNWWDMVTATALLYTMVVTPFEAGFLPPTTGWAAWAGGKNKNAKILSLFSVCLLSSC